VVEGVVEPIELAHLPYKKGNTYEDYVGLRGLRRLGKKKWRRAVEDVAGRLLHALQADELVLGGGNAKLLTSLPPNARLGDNFNAFVGGFRLWNERAPSIAEATTGPLSPERRRAPDAHPPVAGAPPSPDRVRDRGRRDQLA
jgi:polyphosphate glucokinase